MTRNTLITRVVYSTFFFFFLEMWISVSEVYMELVRLNGTNRASVSAILLRAVMTSELKELHCVKRPFKNREKWKRRGWNRNKTSDPCGARTFGATSNWKKNPLRRGEANICCSHTAAQSCFHTSGETVADVNQRSVYSGNTEINVQMAQTKHHLKCLFRDMLF